MKLWDRAQAYRQSLMAVRRKGSRAIGAGSGALAAVVLTGCGAAPSGAAAQEAGVGFVHAILHQDGARACSMLTVNAKSSVVGTTNVSCQKAILQVDEKTASVGAVQAWGDSAQVKVGSDTIFLLRLSDGWRVDAAGCTAAASDAPYNCDIGG